MGILYICPRPEGPALPRAGNEILAPYMRLICPRPEGPALPQAGNSYLFSVLCPRPEDYYLDQVHHLHGGDHHSAL